MALNRIFPFVFFLLTVTGGFSQITFPINQHDGQTIETCSGTFVDSGGDTLTAYGTNENFSLTFCSSEEENPFLELEFLFFELGQGDMLHVYDGDSDQAPLIIQASNYDLDGEIIVSSGECLHFHFVSSPSDPGAGWYAPISCKTLCETFVAEIIPDENTFKYCPETGNVSFSGSATYQGDNVDYDPTQFVYEWTFGEETFTGSQITIFLDEPAAYPLTLSVEDPQNDCIAQVTEIVLVGTVPSFDGTISTADTTCLADPFSLVGVVTPTIWTGFPTAVVETEAIPDGTGEHYESSIVFDVFEDDAEILSAIDVDRVCLNIEHVNHGQLQFELECPNGATVMLKDYGSGTANLGEPVVWSPEPPGVGYEYCFTNDEPQYGTMAETTPQYHEYTDTDGNYYFNAPYLPPGSYTPDETLAALTGCPLNGEWTLRVKDNVPGDNGHMFGWSLFFHEDFYPDSLIFTPEIVFEQWYMGDTPLEGNPASVTLDEPGDYDFWFVAEDNFGCSYDTTLSVHALPLPNAEIISELEMPVCEGDSTLLTVQPINNDGHHWVYQWMYEGVDIPDATYDTLMAKEPGSYMVMVLDTITGCQEFIDFLFEDQNCDLNIPNVFTPNADGINDYFEIENLEHYPQAQIQIFNRWGKKVFEHSDYYGNWWDGRDQPDGVYYYVLIYSRGGERKYAEGVVHIIR